MGCKGIRPETRYNEDTNARKRFLVGLQASKGVEGMEGNFQVAFATTKSKRYDQVSTPPLPPTEEVQVTLENT